MRMPPKCLRKEPIWYVTAMEEMHGRPTRIRISASTLSRLRCDDPSDFTDYKTAKDVFLGHQHWLDGLAFRVKPPIVAVVIQDCITPVERRVAKPIREFLQSVGGYWERTGQWGIQGILASDNHLPSRAGEFRRHAAFVCTDGVFQFTGRTIDRFNGDPMSVDQDCVAQLAVEVHRTGAESVQCGLDRRRRPVQGSLF